MQPFDASQCEKATNGQLQRHGRIKVTHIGMPFGAAASGIAWHKIGHLLLMIGRIMLGLPLYRYVDDYFSADR